MRNYDLYGFETTDLESIRIELEKILDVRFVAHESLYRGPYYRANGINQEIFILQENFIPFEEELMEEKFPEIKVLFYVDDTERSQQIKEQVINNVKGISLLKQTNL